ncbi:hypothetical protein Dimus_039720 [Dionaea muscipula]
MRGMPERRLPERRLHERRLGGLLDRRLGGWNTVLRRSYRDKLTTAVQQSQRRMITIFVEDLPKRMDQRAFQKMFNRFEVVKDAYIPRKRSKEGKRFGFIRYDYMVAAEIAIQKTNDLWIDDKELMVKRAEFDKSKEKSLMSRGNKVIDVHRDIVSNPRMKERQARLTDQQGKRLNRTESYADVVRNAGAKEDMIPLVRGDCVGNDWLYRSVVATFCEHPRTDILFDSFMEQEKDILTVRKMSFNQILITLQSVGRMKELIEKYKSEGNGHFSSIIPWSVKTTCTVGREVWLTCYGVPVHAWNVSTFTAIGNVCGKVLQIEDDTAKCIRCDIGKIKVFTQFPSVINQQLNLQVGALNYRMRVSEEQAIFICSSDFRCGRVCHGGRVGEQSSVRSSDKDDDDVEGGGCRGNPMVGVINGMKGSLRGGSCENRDDRPPTFIGVSHANRLVGGEARQPQKILREEEMRGFVLPESPGIPNDSGEGILEPSQRLMLSNGSLGVGPTPDGMGLNEPGVGS